MEKKDRIPHIARELTRHYTALGMSHTEIAEAIGISRPAVSNILNGKYAIGKNIAKRMHDVYGFDIAFLLTGEGSLFPASRSVNDARNSTITQGDNSPINITATASALQAENDALRRENEWLRGMVESLTKRE